MSILKTVLVVFLFSTICYAAEILSSTDITTDYSGEPPVTINWNKVDELVSRLDNGIINNFLLIATCGYTAGQLSVVMEELKEAAYEDVSQIIEQMRTGVRSQSLTASLTRQYEKLIHSRIRSLVRDVRENYSDIRFSNEAAIGVAQLFKDTFDKIEANSEKIVNLLESN